MSRVSLFKSSQLNHAYPALPTERPSIPNVAWTAADGTLSDFEALEFWLWPNRGFSNVGYPLTLNLRDGFLRGVSADPMAPVVLDLKRIAKQQGDILVQRASSTSLRVWVHSNQVPPAALIEVMGLRGTHTANNPLAIFWGVGQTSADDDLQDKAAAAFFNGYYRHEWVGNAPDEHRFGGNNINVRALDAADVDDNRSLIVSGGADDEMDDSDHKWIAVPAGEYAFRFRGRFGVVGDSNFAVILAQVQQNTDAIRAGAKAGNTTATVNPFDSTDDEIDTILSFSRRLRFAAEEQVTIVSGQANEGVAAQRQSAYSLEVEKILEA